MTSGFVLNRRVRLRTVAGCSGVNLARNGAQAHPTSLM